MRSGAISDARCLAPRSIRSAGSGSRLQKRRDCRRVYRTVPYEEVLTSVPSLAWGLESTALANQVGNGPLRPPY